jgi:hypothetical protein
VGSYLVSENTKPLLTTRLGYLQHFPVFTKT